MRCIPSAAVSFSLSLCGGPCYLCHSFLPPLLSLISVRLAILSFLFTELRCVISHALVCLAIGQPLWIHYPFYRHALITQFPTSITVLLCIVHTPAARAIPISFFSSQTSPPHRASHSKRRHGLARTALASTTNSALVDT